MTAGPAVTVTLNTTDGPMDAVVCAPKGLGKAPGVVVLQEIFGVNDHFKDVCRRLALEGFIAAAPELFHRSGQGIVYSNAEVQKGIAELGRFTNEGLEVDVQASINSLRANPRCTGKIAVIGFCVGGFASFLSACRTNGDAFVAFYGGGIVNARPPLKLQPLLGEVGKIQKPVLCFYGGNDQSIPPAECETVRGALASLPIVSEVKVYPDAGHAFFNDTRPTYAEAAAVDSWQRTLRFLRLALGRTAAPDATE